MRAYATGEEFNHVEVRYLGPLMTRMWLATPKHHLSRYAHIVPPPLLILAALRAGGTRGRFERSRQSQGGSGGSYFLIQWSRRVHTLI